MRTNIVIDPTVLDAAMRAGPYKTKKDAVEAGLKLLARQAAYREILRWEGKLAWDDGAESATADAPVTRIAAHEPGATAERASPVLTGAALPTTREPARRGRR
jgi:Arc/MetJ family transcription regulator